MVRMSIDHVHTIDGARRTFGFTVSLSDFQSGTIIEQLNQNTHVYQYTIRSMVRSSSLHLRKASLTHPLVRLSP